MITTHHNRPATQTRTHTGRVQERPGGVVAPQGASRSTGAAPATADRVPVRFIFQGGDDLSITDVAVLRFFVAAGIRLSCVLDGSDRAPDLAAHRAALHSI